MKRESKFHKPFGVLAIAFLFLVGCSEMEVNFEVNGQSALSNSAGENLAETPDTANMLRVFVGDTVIFRNTTEPASSVNTQKWDIDGDELIDEEFNDIPAFKTVFSKPDRFMAALWVNDAAFPVRLWIDVQGEYEVIEEIVPSIEFVQPESRIERSDDRTYQFEASLTEIYSSDSIILLVNGEPQDFTYDEMTGILNQELRLENGENEIELIAFVGGGDTYSESATLSYGDDSPISTYVPPKETSAPAKEKPIKKEPPKAAPAKPTPAPVKETLSDFAKAGFRSESVTDACRDDLLDSYTFTVTPTKAVKIDDFVIFNTVCGALEIKISSKEGELMTTTETLTEGKSQISFGLFTEELYLNKGVEYQFSLNPVKGNSNCGSSKNPQLVDTKACAPKLRTKSHLKTDFKGKSIIHDITYTY